MPVDWKTPTTPTITAEYCEHLLATDHRKPHAFDTTFRYSSVLSCSRSLSYDAAGIEPSDPMDGPSLAITAQGSLLHEPVQDAYRESYPDAEVEAKSQIGDLISGSADLVHDLECIEIKTVGGFKFDQAIGLRRYGRGRGRLQPKGPSLSHICQAGMNARALGCETVRIVYISREAISVNLAQECEFSSIERFCAEWVIGKEVWWPLVEQELARLERIRGAVNNGKATPRTWITDTGDEKLIDPEKGVYPCSYCNHRTTCTYDGPGVVPIEIRRSA